MAQGQKRTPKPKNRTNCAKEFSEQFRFEGTTNKTRVSRQIAPKKFTRKFCKIFVAQVLWSTFSVPQWSTNFLVNQPSFRIGLQEEVLTKVAPRKGQDYDTSLSMINPKGPKIEIIQDRLRDFLKISSEPPSKPLFFFCLGDSEGQDWKFNRGWNIRSRLKFSIEIEFFQSLGP